MVCITGYGFTDRLASSMARFTSLWFTSVPSPISCPGSIKARCSRFRRDRRIRDSITIVLWRTSAPEVHPFPLFPCRVDFFVVGRIQMRSGDASGRFVGTVARGGEERHSHRSIHPSAGPSGPGRPASRTRPFQPALFFEIAGSLTESCGDERGLSGTEAWTDRKCWTCCCPVSWRFSDIRAEPPGVTARRRIHAPRDSLPTKCLS